MVAAYYLIVILQINVHFNPSIEKIPMQSLQACMTAKNLVLDNQIADKAICVPTGEK
ncbi:MAG: hypothetical protein [Bacteriophage sp.]|nr:MAG: hypothetical protein [Bacteriophage sp.]